LRKVIKRLTNKNSTENGISIIIIKWVIETVGEKICHSMNKSLEGGIFLHKE